MTRFRAGARTDGPARAKTRRLGLSLMEVLVAVTIVSILSGMAYGLYASHIPEAEQTRAYEDLKTVADALAAYDHDNPASPFSTSTLATLNGRYLDDTPSDAWKNDYIVDTFFQRVISMGPNGQLDTLVPELLPPPQGSLPGGTSPPQTSQGSDDIVRVYGVYGKITFIDGGSLLSMVPDGSMVVPVVTGLAAGDSGALSPDRNRFLLSRSGHLSLVTVMAEQTIENPITSGGQPLAATEPSWSRDGLKFCFIGSGSPPSVSISEIATTPTTGQASIEIPSVNIVQVSTSIPSPVSPVLARDNSGIVFVDGGGNLISAASGGGSTVTTINMNALTTPSTPLADAVRVAWSPDGKQLAYIAKDGIYLKSLRGPYLNAMGQVDPNADKKDPGRMLIHSGSFTGIAWSPDGSRLALAQGAQLLLTPARSSVPLPYPLLVYTGSGNLTSLSWR